MKLLLCTDMDRTVIPNGHQLEAPDARQNFRQFCADPSVTLVYVTGRHRQLVQDAIKEFELPWPDYAITDVGTRIYQIRDDQQWQSMRDWEVEIDQDWINLEPLSVLDLLSGIHGIRLQEESKQNPHKISFYIDLEKLNEATCLARVSERLESLKCSVNKIWSIDETSQTGLLDILPSRANKLHAIEFLQAHLNYAADEVIFAGDSGNDLEVLISKVPSVLVANATDDLKQQTLKIVQSKGTEKQFYLAENLEGYSGHYSAGVLQGVFHYRPEFEQRYLKGL